LFVDESDPARPPWRFHFTEASVTPAVPSIYEPREMRYMDPGRKAELVCAAGTPRDLPEAERAKLPQSGCELRVGGAVQFSINYSDKGLDRIQGFLGPLPTNDSPIARGPAQVIGVRIQSLPSETATAAPFDDRSRPSPDI
jgi:hypothetical protein